MGSYRDLEVWQLSRVLTKDVYQMTSGFPKSELFGLSSQMRRCAVSITCNIAEGQGRWSAADQCHFYNIARGSLLEIETQLFIALDVGYIDQTELNQRLAQTEKMGKKLNTLISSTRNRKTEDRGPRTED